MIQQKLCDAPSDGCIKLEVLHSTIHAKNSNNQTMICIIMHNTLSIKLHKGSNVINRLTGVVPVETFSMQKIQIILSEQQRM
jgi:hypothetical protein